MKLALGADERLPIIETIQTCLTERGHQVAWLGPSPGQTAPWPQVARQVAEAVSSGKAEEGILLCWTGTGVSIAANKVRRPMRQCRNRARRAPVEQCQHLVSLHGPDHRRAGKRNPGFLVRHLLPAQPQR